MLMEDMHTTQWCNGDGEARLRRMKCVDNSGVWSFDRSGFDGRSTQEWTPIYRFFDPIRLSLSDCEIIHQSISANPRVWDRSRSSPVCSMFWGEDGEITGVRKLECDGIHVTLRNHGIITSCEETFVRQRRVELLQSEFHIRLEDHELRVLEDELPALPQRLRRVDSVVPSS